jgi:putative membrane protein
MPLISESDRSRIAAAIMTAEQHTSGEIVAIIAPNSSSYLHVPFLWGALAALVVPWPFVLFTWWPIQHIYLLQIAVFAALALILLWPPLRLALVPRSVRHRRAHRRAVEQFLAQNMHTTAGRTGVLIFVSMAERYAEILADAGIHKRVAESEWQGIVDDLTKAMAEGRPGDGFVAAIEAVGKRLAQHFPPGSHDPHALPNHLIMLPSD